MTLPAIEVSTSSPTTVASPLSEQQQRLETLQRDYAELNTAIFEAAQVHRRLCAPSLLRHGAFDVATEIFAVRHLPGDFVSVEETRDGLVLALGDIGGKGLAGRNVGDASDRFAANTHGCEHRSGSDCCRNKPRYRTVSIS